MRIFKRFSGCTLSLRLNHEVVHHGLCPGPETPLLGCHRKYIVHLFELLRLYRATQRAILSSCLAEIGHDA